MKKSAPIIACGLIFLLGLGVMFYPTFSNWIHKQNASYVISDYLQQTSIKTEDEAQQLFAEASAYNETLTGDVKSFMIAEDNQENVLQKGVGHLEGSALPTGEIGNHTVLTGHTGLPSAELFTDLDQLEIGDVFYLQVLNRVFTYEITEI